MTRIFSTRLLTLCLCFGLGACSYFEEEEKGPLEGDRMSLYDFEKSLQQDPNTQFGLDGTEEFQRLTALPETLRGQTDQEIDLVAPWVNKFWPQVGGYPNNTMKHVALSPNEPSRVWSSSIGRGSSKRLPLTAAPIIADNMVFTLNTRAEVTAFDQKSGKKLWEKDIIRQGEDEVVIGGGLAFSGGKLFATNGFNEVIAMDPSDGRILWRADTKSPIRAAPAAIPGRVFVTTLDNQTLAFNATNGQRLWSHRGLSGNAGILGAATPAITRDAVFTAYNSGEVYALQIDTGLELWVQNLSPLARVAGRTMMSDIRALPVADNGVIYATSLSNRMSAIDARTGEPVWQSPIGSATTPWVSGNRLFAVETQNTLVSLNIKNGDVVWQTPLPQFEDAEDRDDPISWQGPLLAGGRLMVFGSHGVVQEHNPTNGEIIREWDARGDVRLPVAVADQTLFMIDEDGDLSAWQ
jgi:outer membrane protein assembly factor BamB